MAEEKAKKATVTKKTVETKEKRATTPKTAASKTAPKKTTTTKTTVTKAVESKKATTTPKTKSTSKKTTVAPKSTPTKETKSSNSPKVLYVSSEAYPYAATGSMGEALLGLPRAMRNSGSKVGVIMPLYERIDKQALTHVTNIEVHLAWRTLSCGLFKTIHDGVEYYFVENDYYFKREHLYSYYDDVERFAFFSKAILELLPHISFTPDILHCHDWQTALVSVYHKLFFADLHKNLKTVFTIHTVDYQGNFDFSTVEDIFGIDAYHYPSLEFDGQVNLLKSAIEYSDVITTVSPTYLKELLSNTSNLSNIIKDNVHKFKGILNGMDTKKYNPETNPSLFKNFSSKTLEEDKKINKTELQKMLSLPVDESVPILCVVGRMTREKGYELLRRTMDDMLSRNIQMILLGEGDIDLENYFMHMSHSYNNKVSAIVAYNRDLANKIFAGSDVLLMPSRREACGLAQMVASCYGCVPLVRKTGGLGDSIVDCEGGDVGNGFVFQNFEPGEFMHAFDRAIGLYFDYREKFNGLAKRVMQHDFSWDKSAKEYAELYNNLTK
ncbi:MAG: glycogen synthase [Firmicutes bacterium]|nr:glycogen synthase [Bacillota bacterium]MCL2255679.1 glycogen synthase [Bacillota bacterium]